MADYETGVNVILGGSIGPRIRATLEEYADRKGMPFREYVRTNMGFMAALLALNKASGMRVYDVVEEEALDESAIADRRKGPGFILDDQTHIFFRKGDTRTHPQKASYSSRAWAAAEEASFPAARG